MCLILVREISITTNFLKLVCLASSSKQFKIPSSVRMAIFFFFYGDFIKPHLESTSHLESTFINHKQPEKNPWIFDVCLIHPISQSKPASCCGCGSVSHGVGTWLVPGRVTENLHPINFCGVCTWGTSQNIP